MKLNIKVLFDNPNPERKDRGWGISFLLNGTILFDTTESFEKLQSGLEFFNVQLQKIRDVVISHDHWDHTGGLADFIAAHPDASRLNVYLLPSFSPELKQQVMMSGASVHVNSFPAEIRDGFILTGKIDGVYKGEQKNEQGLVAAGEHAFALITGCAHPGVAQMLKASIEIAGTRRIPRLVAGGFHLMDKSEDQIEQVFSELQKLGVEKMGPCHCSGISAKNICKRLLPEAYVDIQKKGEFDFDL
ncbi:MAG: MBL fold metallo-hydrolase [Acidobacteria bacterium]|nr:MBL fold metallo-hydrolase [Acidobacteriota bacterium]